MIIELSAHEARVIGCLIEKEITTPEQYPLSLNALANACNQKSKRDPVLELDEATIQETPDKPNWPGIIWFASMRDSAAASPGSRPNWPT